MKDSKGEGEDPATKFVKRRQAEAGEEDDAPLLPKGWFIGIGAGIGLAIIGVIVWMLYR